VTWSFLGPLYTMVSWIIVQFHSLYSHVFDPNGGWAWGLSIASMVVPLLSPYRPLWVALGIVAAELLLALAVTNHYRRRLPYHLWRRAHYANFAVWSLALVHGILAGTDTGSGLTTALYAVSAGTVAGLTLWRVLRGLSLAPWAARLWPGTAAVVTAELIAMLSSGPRPFA